ESPLPSFEDRKGSELCEVAKRYFRSFADENLASALSDALVSAFLKSIAGKRSLKEGVLSEYQYANLYSLFKYASNNVPSISLLAAPTGTGKTWVFVLYIIARILEAKIKGEIDGVKVVIVYPRKALARDQFERILRLLHVFNEELRRRGLKRYAVSLGIWDGDSLEKWEKIAEMRRKRGGQDVEFRGIKCPLCNAKLVYRKEERCIVCSSRSCGMTYEYIGDVREWISEVQPDILITNFWALNYRLISRRYKHLLSSSIRCIVIDEAHVLKDLEGAFTSYLLCRILLRLAMQYKGVSTDTLASLRLDPKLEYDALDWIREYLKDRNFTIVLSSATISTAPTVNERRKDAEDFARNLVYPRLYEVFEGICKGRGFSPIIYHDHDEIYQKLYGGSPAFKKLRRKIDVVVIVAPHPMRGLETIAQATALCSLFWSKEFGQKFLLFADNKEAIERLYHFINDIIIGERGEIYDHVFLTDRNPGSHISHFIRGLWKNYGNNLMSKSDILVKALDDPLYWLAFTYTSYFSDIMTRYGDLSKVLSFVYSNQEIHFNNLLDVAKSSCDDIFNNRTLRLDVHHADLDRQRRQEIEERLKKADLLGVLCTSTLELGIDIDHITTIIQYRPPIAAESFIQRLGRAGRKPATMYIAVGFLLLSNFDTLYLNESYSDEVLFSVRPRPLPLENHRVRANAIIYTIVDLLAYLDHRTHYSSRLRDAVRTGEKIRDIYQALVAYEKPLVSIIASSLGLPLNVVKREYIAFRDYLEVLYNNLKNINTAPMSIKNILYDAIERLQVLKNDLAYRILRPIGSNPNYLKDSETYQRVVSQMFQAESTVSSLYNELYKLDLYCEAYPEY
ncbi:MAG TPA: DEAD/DEAH box helicase, partial [Thermoprotei archaeon]|nr:DEAD/DEAH box helicase [Thermoprotei archaeon]